MRSAATIVALLLPACGGLDDAVELDPPDDAVVARAMTAAQPELLIELVEAVRDFVPFEDGCPFVVDESDSDFRRETWLGGCALADGTVVEGRLDLFEGPDGAWVAGDDFAVRSLDLDLYLDGAVELLERGDLLLLDAAATWCGGPGASCADGPATVDLSYSIFPLAGYPTSYDATVSGAIDSDDALVTVEGTWSVDLATCADEPASGTFAMSSGERHAIEMDGATACDACATWVVQGVETVPFCGVDL